MAKPDAVVDESSEQDEPIDGEESFVQHIVEKYAESDAADADEEDGIDRDEEDGDDTADDDDEEHPDADTSDEEDDEPSDDSDADSSDDDDTEHTDDEPDSDDVADDTADDEDAEEGEDEPEDTKAALTRAGADLKLEDVPEKYRPIIEKKIKGIDAAFTRYAQDAAATRVVRGEMEAEKKFRKENAELVVIEMLRADDTLFDKVNAKLKELADPTVEEAFKIVVQKKKDDAKAAAAEEIGREDRTEARIVEVETTTRKLAADNGVPFWIADEAIGTAYLLKKRADPNSDLTAEEIAATVTRVAKKYRLDQRANGRQESKEQIRDRTNRRKNAAPTKKPALAASPRPNGKKPPAVDFSNEESRQAAILRSARRIIPGAKD